MQRQENTPGSREVAVIGQLGVFKGPNGFFQLLNVPALRGLHQLRSHLVVIRRLRINGGHCGSSTADDTVGVFLGGGGSNRGVVEVGVRSSLNVQQCAV